VNIQISAPPNIAINAQQSKTDDVKLKKACRDFESMLVYQMLNKMRQTVEKSNLFGSNEQEKTFQGMLDEQLAAKMSESGAIGIGDIIYNQITGQAKNVAKVFADKIDK
jgi:peptidoglycan hydrolase FlgJ